MIDLATLALTHGLMAIALWRMLSRPELDNDGAVVKAQRRAWSRAVRGTARPLQTDSGDSGDA